ncbi:replication protein A 70 kDa DNA-binding subunit B [Tanacetum coccineum]
MGYQKTPTLSSNNYKKNAGVGGSGRFGGSSGLSSNTYKQKTNVGASNSTRYGGSSSLSTNGYKGRSNGYGGSKIVGFVGGSGGNGKDKKITPISEVDPMLNDITIQGRCISIWHSHRMNAAHDPYSLDLVLQDVHEGQCLHSVQLWDLDENSGRLPLLPHRYKISFYKCTTVTRIEPFDSNTNGFILEPFHHLLDPEHHQYYGNDAVDVIGSVVGIGDIVPVMSAAGKKIRRTIVAEDVEYKFKVILRVIDESGSAPLLFFNNNFVKLSGRTTWEIIEKYNMDPDDYWHEEELDHIIGKKCLFKLFYSEYNVTKNNHTYRCDSFSEDVELINHFKKNFIDTESDDEDSSDDWDNLNLRNKAIHRGPRVMKMILIMHTSCLIQHNQEAIIEDTSDEDDTDIHTASKSKKNKTIIEDTTSRVEVSTSKKRKLIIDQHEVESEPEEEGNISKANELVAEQMESEE